MKILITGRNGLLAKALGECIRKQLSKGVVFDNIEVFETDRKTLDITDPYSVKKVLESYKPDVVLHLAAYTDVGKAEVEKKACYRTNVLGTQYLAKYAKHLIYLSTEYVFDGERGNYQEEDIPNPQNFYSLTKLLGEHEASKATRYTIIRTLFKPRPYKHDYVATDMWTSGRYVDEIAPEIVHALRHADKLPRVIHIGFERINLAELAKQTRTIIPIRRTCMPIRLPKDTSLNTRKWKAFKETYK